MSEAFDASDRRNEMKRALIVGIDQYQHAPLYGCVNDANRIHQILSQNEDGSPNFQCKLLTAPPYAINRSTLREHIKDIFDYEADAAFFYYSGHGTVNNLGGYLVTQDATKYDEGVAMSDLLSYANDANIREVVIVLDCCHSGAFGQIPAIKDGQAVLREGISVLTASRSSQPSVEIDGSGIFTSLVCEALNGGAADVCGKVTVASVYAYVDQVLGAWDQRPLFKSHVSRLITLRQCKPEMDLAILRLLPKYFPAPTAELPLDPSFEPDTKPRNAENEQIFRNLQKFRDARLLEPVGEEHLYFAAIRSKSCKLTPLGQFYWQLAKKKRI